MSLLSNPSTSPLARMTPLLCTSTAALPLPIPAQRPSPRSSAEVVVGSAGSARSPTRLSAEGHQVGAVDLSTINIPGTRTRKESLGRGMSTISNPPIPNILIVKTNSSVQGYSTQRHQCCISQMSTIPQHDSPIQIYPLLQNQSSSQVQNIHKCSHRRRPLK